MPPSQQEVFKEKTRDRIELLFSLSCFPVFT